MRELSARNLIEVNKSHPAPVFLVEIGLDPVVRISSNGPTTVGGVTYQQGYLDMQSISWGPSGEGEASFLISSAFTELALSGYIIDKKVLIGVVWGEAPYANDDYLGLFVGAVSEAPMNRDYVQIKCTQLGTKSRKIPSVEYAHQNIQPAGTKVTLVNTTITIERAEGEE